MLRHPGTGRREMVVPGNGSDRGEFRGRRGGHQDWGNGGDGPGRVRPVVRTEEEEVHKILHLLSLLGGEPLQFVQQ